MKPKHGVALAVILAALVLGVIGSASASAAECPGTGEGLALCSGGHALEGTFEFTSKHKSLTAEQFTISGIMTLSCSTSTGKGDIVATKTHVEVTKDIIEWSQCKLGGHANCKVKPFVFGGTTGLNGALSETGEIGQIIFSSPVKETWGEISVIGCEQEYEGKVTGTQKCQISRATTELAVHEVVCSPTGSSLKVHLTQAEMTNSEELQLTSGKAFSLQHA
jgi:hypothetical protein